jgi:NitT/TauT family transport system permease protein/putative hydroxymethylpyrimidine transport system permease protein
VSGWRRGGSRALDVIAPIALVAILIAAWQIAATEDWIADALDLEPFLVPSPSEIWTALTDNWDLLMDNMWVTLSEVVLGFALALAVGVAFAVALHLWPLLRRAFYPLIVASQTIPVIVIAPILVVWLGFGIGPKVVIIALICFFPITVNMLDGLGSVGPEQHKLMRSLGATRLQTLRRLELPASLPYLFTGAKISIAVAVIGAVFGEWAGSDEGLGHLILVDNAQLEVARMFAAIVVLAAMAMALFGLVALLERFGWWRRTGDAA